MIRKQEKSFCFLWCLSISLPFILEPWTFQRIVPSWRSFLLSSSPPLNIPPPWTSAWARGSKRAWISCSLLVRSSSRTSWSTELIRFFSRSNACFRACASSSLPAQITATLGWAISCRVQKMLKIRGHPSPLVLSRSRWMRTGYLVIRCVTNKMHSWTPWRRSRGPRQTRWASSEEERKHQHRTQFNPL